MEPGWLLYLGVFLGPFIQEDAAVLAAASLSAANADHFPTVFGVILAGLFLSDVWKDWIGYSAHASSRARTFAEKEHVQDFSDKVGRNLFMTLVTARFVPLARIPAYVACGYFKVNYFKFCLMIFVTALMYCSVVFALCHWLGELMGDRIEVILMTLGATIVGVVVIVLWIRSMRRKQG